MAIKRKTISIKSIKLVKPKYSKVPKKEIRLPFVEPVRVSVEEIKPKKQKKSKKQKQSKKIIHNKPLVLTSKQLTKLKKPKKQKVKKPKIRKAKKARISTFAGAFPTEPQIPEFTEDGASWDIVQGDTLSKFYNAVHSIADESTRPKLAHQGADILYDMLRDDISQLTESQLADFLIQYPLTDFFDCVDLFYGALGTVTGDNARAWVLTQAGNEIASVLSYDYLHTLADSFDDFGVYLK